MSHSVDGYASILWRFDETIHYNENYTTAIDETGNYNLTQSTNSLKPMIQGGPDADGYYCRWHDGVDDYMSAILDTPFRNALDAGYSVECWVYFEESGSTATIFEASGNLSLETSAENCLFSLRITSSDFIQVFWEHGASGTNEFFTDSITTIPVREWTHIGVTVENSSTPTISSYINGSFSDSGTITTRADGGGNAEIRLSSDDTLPFIGGIADLRFSDKERSSAEIAASAAASNNRHTNDANTLALWRFSERPEIVDIGSFGYHLHPKNFATAIANFTSVVDPLITTGKGRHFNEAVTDILHAPKRQIVNDLFIGEWTIEWWMRREHGPISAVTRHLFGYGGTGESLATNVLSSIYFDATDNINVLWEHGAGGTDVLSTSANTVSDIQSGQNRHHFAIVKSDAGGSTYDVDFYYDGIFVETLGSGLTNAAGATDSTVKFRIGEDTTGALPWGGVIDDIRISSKARSATEVLSSYNSGASSDIVKYYQMRGNDDGDLTQPSSHAWVVTDAPDPTGAQATGDDAPPFGGPLTNIYVSNQWSE
jgi:hypothetical protein